MQKITKKYVIEKLRSQGIKATYSNVAWLYNGNFEIVGGVSYALSVYASKQYFIIENGEIVFVNSIKELKKKLEKFKE